VTVNRRAGAFPFTRGLRARDKRPGSPWAKNPIVLCPGIAMFRSREPAILRELEVARNACAARLAETGNPRRSAAAHGSGANPSELPHGACRRRRGRGGSSLSQVRGHRHPRRRCCAGKSPAYRRVEICGARVPRKPRQVPGECAPDAPSSAEAGHYSVVEIFTSDRALPEGGEDDQGTAR
jgi:hypothetical protein